MRHSIIRTFCTLILLAATAQAGAQTYTQSSFFLDNNPYSYRLNPSLKSNYSAFGFGINNIGASIQSNIGVSSLLYPASDGRLVTGFNSEVSSKEFLSNLSERNSASIDFSENLLSFSRQGDTTSFNFEVNIRGNASAVLPYDLFAFHKDGSDGDDFDLSDTRAGGSLYAEVAIGLSRRINDKVRVGGRIKGLVGLANANVDVKSATLHVGEDKVAVQSDAELRSAGNVLTIDTKTSEYDENVHDVLDMSSACYGSVKPAGYGAALDLGVEVTPIKGLTLSASVLDLGGIQWKYDIVGKTTGKVEYTGFNDLGVDNAGDNIDDEVDRIKDELESLAEFHEQSEGESAFGMLPFTFNAGVRWQAVKMLSVGALYSLRGGDCGWNDLRAGATFTPSRHFSLSANAGVTTFGPVMGGAMNLSLLGVQLFIAGDGYIGSISNSDGIPFPVDKFRYNVNFGMLFEF